MPKLLGYDGVGKGEVMVPASRGRPHRQLGERIGELRRAASRARGSRLTQAEVARRVGVAEGTVTAWEIGVQRPDERNTRALAEVLGCTVEAIERPTLPHLARSVETAEAVVLTEDAVLQLLTAVAPPGKETDLKADQLQLVRRVALATGQTLPGWWYELLRRVDAGEL